MSKKPTPSKHAKIIKKLRRRKNLIITVAVIAAFLILAASVPTIIFYPAEGEPLIDIQYKGIPLAVSLLLFVLCIFIEAILIMITVQPHINRALTEECDPEKFLEMSLALDIPRNIPRAKTLAYLFLGYFGEAIKYSEPVIKDRLYTYHLAGLYNKALCEFFLEDHEAFHNTVAEYSRRFEGNGKIPQKARPLYENIFHVLSVLTALADNDAEKLAELKSSLHSYSKSRSSNVIIKYIKGLAESRTGNADAATVEFEWVKENAKKTVFSALANRRLMEMSGEYTIET